MATEPEHPTGELGQSGEQTERRAGALCPYIALQSSPSAPAWAPRKPLAFRAPGASQTGQRREGPRTQRRPQHSLGEKLITGG